MPTKPTHPKRVLKKKSSSTSRGRVVQELTAGLREAKHALMDRSTEGELFYWFHGQKVNPRAIREKILGVTRDVFSEMFAIDIASLRNWETGRRKPSPHTLAYYLLIEKNARGVYKTLYGAQPPITFTDAVTLH